MAIRRRRRRARLLEFPHEDRLDLINLLAAPTDSLLQIRRKCGADHVLARSEWTVIAHFAQNGIEALAMTTPNRMLSDSLTAVLDAFAAVYDLRTDAATGRDPYYLGNLPPERRPASTRGEPHDVPTAETVRQTLAETRRRLGHPTTPLFPFLAARNLRVLLDEDTLPRAELIHQALRPYWPVLWRLAVQGHYATTGKPVPDVQAARGALVAGGREL